MDEEIRLRALENESLYVMREAYRKFPKLALLWSMGKDSTVMLWLARKAFFGPCTLQFACLLSIWGLQIDFGDAPGEHTHRGEIFPIR